MADIITIATRRISGTGQIRLTTDELKNRRYTLYADVIRKPRTPYFNRKYEPPQTFYGYISLMNQGYLLQTLSISYDSQVWIFDADISGQNLIATKCEYKGILETFFNLGNALLLPSISVVNTIEDYKFLPLAWDNVIIKCDGDAAIQFVLKALPYDSCVSDYKNPASTAPAPAKPESVPPGTPTEISPAYPGDTITKPAVIDESYVPPPLGTACVPGTLRFDYTYLESGVPTAGNKAIAVWGKVGRTGRSVSAGVIQIQHQGLYPGESCGAFDWRDVESLGPSRPIQSVSNITFT